MSPTLSPPFNPPTFRWTTRNAAGRAWTFWITRSRSATSPGSAKAGRILCSMATDKSPRLKAILQITGFTDNPRGVKLRYKLVQSSPDAVSGSPDDSRLVMDTEHYDIYHPEPGELDWGFKCFIPPDH